MDVKLFLQLRQRAISSNAQTILTAEEIGIMDIILSNYKFNGKYEIGVLSSKFDFGDIVENNISFYNYYDSTLNSLKSKKIINDYYKTKMVGLKDKVGYFISLI